MRLSLVPRPAEFYDLFTEAGANALTAAQKAETRIPRVPEFLGHQADVKAVGARRRPITVTSSGF
jgi:hypothetical protein